MAAARCRFRATFVLYSDTGLALQLGHRNSEDFDFFSTVGFDPDRLKAQLPFFNSLGFADPGLWIHRERDNLEPFVILKKDL